MVGVLLCGGQDFGGSRSCGGDALTPGGTISTAQREGRKCTGSPLHPALQSSNASHWLDPPGNRVIRVWKVQLAGECIREQISNDPTKWRQGQSSQDGQCDVQWQNLERGPTA